MEMYMEKLHQDKSRFERKYFRSFGSKEILEIVKKDFQLDYFGKHGISQWASVFLCQKVCLTQI